MLKKRDILLKEIGEKIRNARLKQDIKTEQVSNDLKVSLSTVTSIERGERSGKILVLYVHYLRKHEVNINELFDIDLENL